MRNKEMVNMVRSIALEKLVAHPDNPNRISRANFAKLVRNIERTGRYEPLIVRPAPDRPDCFQIINGHHRRRVLAKLGYRTAACVVGDVDDEQTDILLATLNRLGGTDEVGKRLKLLKRLNKKTCPGELAKLLPQTAKQIERLVNLKAPRAPATVATMSFANPMVFFVTDEQEGIVERAMSLAEPRPSEVRGERPDCKMTGAQRRAAGLAVIAGSFINNSRKNQGAVINGEKKIPV